MTFGRYVEGLLFIGVAFVPIAVAAYAWRARLLPGWTGPVARLAEIVIGVATVVLVSQVIGAVHLFRVAAMVPALALVGVVGWCVGKESHPGQARSVEEVEGEGLEEATPRPTPTGATLTALVAVSLVAADWATRTVDALHHGMTTADTLWYHMPFAARFVQQDTIVPLHYVDAESVTVFFPANFRAAPCVGHHVHG